MEKKPSIMIVGYYGAGNAGDELLLKLLLSRLPSSVSAIVLSVNPQHTKMLHHVESLSLFRLDEVFNAMLDCRLLILGGGGLLQTHDHFTQGGLQSFDQNEVSAYIRPVLLAKQLGVPILAWAQGVGPLNTFDAKKIARVVFDGANSISVRDVNSLKLLRSLGVSRTTACAPDPIWTMPAICYQQFSRKKSVKKNLVITLRPWYLGEDGWKKSLSIAIDHCVNPDEYAITWLPFLIASSGIDCELVNTEQRIIDEIQSSLSVKFEHKTIVANSFEQLFAAVASADYAICMRMHAQILYHILSVPVISIQYDAKLKVTSNAAGHHAALCVSLASAQEHWNNAVINLFTLDVSKILNSKKRDACINEATLHIELLDRCLNTSSENATNAIAPIERVNFDWLSLWITRQPQLHGFMYKSSFERAQLHINALRAEREQLFQSTKLSQTESQNALASRDQQIIELRSQLNVEKQKALTELRSLKATFSWRITRPFRFFRQFVRSPSRAIYLATKTVYWWLPPRMRSKTTGLRDSFLRWFQKSSKLNSTLPNSSDISWQQFSEKILANRNKYNGVFIQESVIDWDVPLFQRPQHLATAMGKLNHLVIYRTNNWSNDNVQGFRLVAKNVWLSNSEEVDGITDALRSIYSTAAVDQRRIDQFPKNCCIVYEYIDHIDPEISGDTENIARLTRQKNSMTSGAAKFIVASALKLKEEISQQFDPTKVFLIQNGVDAFHYRNNAVNSIEIPAEYTDFCNKFQICLGYFGAVAPWLDYPLINELVRLRQDIGFVFIGPDYYGGLSHLPATANVFITGAVNYTELPAYAQKFDLCWIPFKPGEIAKSTSPLKLFEYFALEKPVLVTSDMQECTVYSEVLHASSSQAMSKQIDRAFFQNSKSSGFKKNLRQLADENNWDHRAAKYSQLFDLMMCK